METVSKSWEEVSADEARRFAALAFGMTELSKHMTRDQIRGELAKVGFTGDTIPVHPKPAGVPGQSAMTIIGNPPPSSVHVEGGRTFVCVRIPNQDKPGGKEAVSVSVNGRRMDIPRERACWIGKEYHEVLLNAKMAIHEEYDPDRNPMGGLESNPQLVHSYPFQYDYTPFVKPGSVTPAAA